MVDIQKLQRLTANTQVRKIDYSQVAHEHFTGHTQTVRTIKKPELPPKSSQQADRAAKAVYNEVQNHSFNIRVPGSEMRTYFEKTVGSGKRRVRSGDTIHGSPALLRRHSVATDSRKSSVRSSRVLNVKSSIDLHEDKLALNTPVISIAHDEYPATEEVLDTSHASHINTIEMPSTPNLLENPFESPPLNTTSKPLSVTKRSERKLSRVSSVQFHEIMTPQNTKQSSGSFTSLPSMRSPTTTYQGLLQTSSPKLSHKKSSSSFTSFFKQGNSKPKVLRHSSTGSPLRKSYSVDTQGSSPSQITCHSVEDTLLADEEFRDFSIPKRSNSYYSSLDRHSSNRLSFPSFRTSSSGISFPMKDSRDSAIIVPVYRSETNLSNDTDVPFIKSPQRLASDTPTLNDIDTITEEEILSVYGRL